MNSSPISCIFNCGQSLSEDEMKRHIKIKCINRLKFIYCKEINEVYANNTIELSNHIKLCNECKMKKVDIDIINKNPILTLKNNHKSNINNTVRSTQPIKTGLNSPLDDTMLNIQLSKKKANHNQDVNNTMIMGENQSIKDKRTQKNDFDESFVYSEYNTNYNGNTIIREYDDEDDYEKKEDEFNDYFINSNKASTNKQSKNIEKEEGEENEKSSSDYEDYFV